MKTLSAVGSQINPNLPVEKTKIRDDDRSVTKALPKIAIQVLRALGWIFFALSFGYLAFVPLGAMNIEFGPATSLVSYPPIAFLVAGTAALALSVLLENWKNSK